MTKIFYFAIETKTIITAATAKIDVVANFVLAEDVDAADIDDDDEGMNG
jgi:hypothetical protein